MAKLGTTKEQKKVVRESRAKHHIKQLDGGKQRLDCYLLPGTKEKLRLAKKALSLPNEGAVVDYIVGEYTIPKKSK